MLHARTKSIRVESATSMTIVNRHYSPIRHGFNILSKEAPDWEKEHAIQMAVKVINESVGSDRLVLILLAFCALSRLGLLNNGHTTLTVKIAIAPHQATAAMSKPFTSRQGRDSLRNRNRRDLIEIYKTQLAHQCSSIVYTKVNGKDPTQFWIFEKRI